MPGYVAGRLIEFGIHRRRHRQRSFGRDVMTGPAGAYVGSSLGADQWLVAVKHWMFLLGHGFVARLATGLLLGLVTGPLVPSGIAVPYIRRLRSRLDLPQSRAL